MVGIPAVGVGTDWEDQSMNAVTLRTLPTVTETDLVPYAQARAAWDSWRVEHGYRPGRPLLTAPGENVKLAKGTRAIYGLSLAPARTSGRNVCAASTRQCRALCLATAGAGRYDNVTAARIMKTQWLWADPAMFVSLALGELQRARDRHDGTIGIRWNVLSDIPWERVAPVLVAPRPRVRAYDYTKLWARDPAATGARYHLTLSRSESTPDADVVAACADGRNVAVAFSTTAKAALPRTFLGVRVIDGDRSDYRPADPSGVIVGLRAKGRARDRRYLGRFVVDVTADGRVAS